MTTTKKNIISVSLSLLIFAILASGVAIEFEPALQKYGKRMFLILLGLSPLYLIKSVRELVDNIFISKFSDFDIFLLPIVTYLISSELSLLWAQKVIGNNYTIAGVLPLVDSKDYYQGAIGLNDFGVLHDWAGRRPLNHLFFGGLFYWAKESHFIVFGIVSFLIIAGTYLFSRNVFERISKVGAFYIPLAVYYFYREYTGSFLSESLGLIMSLASINFLFLVREKGRDRILYLCLSLLSLSIGLSARAGNIIAPFVLVVGYSIWGNWDKKRLRNIILMIATLIFGFSTNKLVRSYYSIEGTATSNLGYVLYGVAQGGMGWTQFSKDYPDLNFLIGQAHIDAVNEKTMDSIRSEPLLFLKGCLVGLKTFLVRYFTFLPSIFGLLEYFFLLASVLLFFIKKPRLKEINPFYFTTFGILLTNIMTSPLLAYDGHQRVYAGTISYVMLSIVFGFNIFKSFSKRPSAGLRKSFSIEIFLLCLIFLLTPLFFIPKDIKVEKPESCGSGESLIFQYRPDYSLIYLVNENISPTKKPRFTNKEIMASLIPGTNLEGIGYNLLEDNEYALISAIDIQEKKYTLQKVYSFPKELVGGIYQFCLEDKVLTSYRKL